MMTKNNGPLMRPRASISPTNKPEESWYSIRAASRGVAEVMLYDDIGAWGISARQFARDLAALGDVSQINLSDGAGWTSAWVRWHSQAAGKARHWRAPSLGEQGALISPSGEPAQGTFVAGLYGNAGPQPDNRDHVEVWRFDDGGSLVYDWQAKSYTISLPSGTVSIQVGGSLAVVTDSAITGKADTITLTGKITLNGDVQINGASLQHNGVNVGSTHTHMGVMPGPGSTGAPH